jgi:hypothetical protein
LFAQASDLGDDIVMAFLLFGNASVAGLLAFEKLSGAFGRRIGSSLEVIAHHSRPFLA